jgi:exosortase/archaeosortase family protein
MSRNKYSLRDIVLYLAVFYVFYALFQWVPSTWAEVMTAGVSSSVFRVFGLNSDYGVNGVDVYLTLEGGSRDVLVYIIRECSAIHVVGVILGLIVPLKEVNWLRKGLGVALGVVLIFVMNIFRVLTTVYLSGYDLPPFSWFFQNPTVETYHYPISFIFGVLGIILTILAVSNWVVPELAEFLGELPDNLIEYIR